MRTHFAQFRVKTKHVTMLAVSQLNNGWEKLIVKIIFSLVLMKMPGISLQSKVKDKSGTKSDDLKSNIQ